MSNDTDTLYLRLHRLLKILHRHGELDLTEFYRLGRRVVPENKTWDLPKYTFKMVTDGEVYFYDQSNGRGVFVRRMIALPMPEGSR